MESSNRPPKFLYFDLGNVLLLFDHEIACRQIGEESGIPCQVVRQIVFDGDLELSYERGDVSTSEFFEILCRQAGLSRILDLNRMCRAAAAIFEVNVPMLSLVSQLRSAGQRLGILSNTCEAHWDYAFDGRYTFLTNLFDVYALSYKLKSLKPEPEIYAAAARLAGYEPTEIFFVDDRPDNVAAAIASGFDAVQFTSVSTLAADLRERGVRFNH